MKAIQKEVKKAISNTIDMIKSRLSEAVAKTRI